MSSAMLRTSRKFLAGNPGNVERDAQDKPEVPEGKETAATTLPVCGEAVENTTP